MRYQIGISMSLIGVPLAMLLNYAYSAISWSPLIMILSVLLVIDYSNLANIFRFPKGVLIKILLYQFLMLIYWVFTGSQIFQYLTFHLYVVALIFALNSNKAIFRVNCVNTLFVLSGVLSLIFAFIHFSGIYLMHRLEMADENVLEVFTMDMASYANLMCCLCLNSSKRKWWTLLLVVMAIIDFYVIIQSGKRSYFVSVFVAFIFFSYKTRNMYKTLIVGFVIGGLLLLLSDAVRDVFADFWDRTIAGMSNVYGEKRVAFDENDSSTYRALALDRIKQTVNTDFSILNYLFGAGYLFAWIDNPLLESYLDMGVLGFIFYLYLIIYYPIKKMKSLDDNNDIRIILIMIAVVNITVLITNNNPYEYFVYTPLCLLGIYDYKHKIYIPTKE